MPNASDTQAAPASASAAPGAGGRRTPPSESTARGWFTTGRALRVAAFLICAGVLLSFPEIAPNPYILSAGVVVLSYACTATAWNFMGGFTGYVSLGHAAFFGLGAYSTALLIRDLDLSPFLAWLVGGVVVLVVTVPVGIAALRVRGASFVIVSIAFVLIMLLVFQGWESFTGGSNGLVVPRPFPEMLRPEHHRAFFYLFAAFLGVMLLAWWAIDRSQFGSGLKAVREDEDKAQALGVPTRNYKLAAYLISGTLTGLAGGLYALWFGDLDPIFQFSIMLGAYMVLMALLGGVRHLFGPLLGALIVGSALEYFKMEFGDTQLHLVATAVLLGLVVLFMPDGIIPAARDLVRRFGPQDSSIREMTAAELLERNRAVAAGSASAEVDPAGATPEVDPAGATPGADPAGEPSPAPGVGGPPGEPSAGAHRESGPSGEGPAANGEGGGGTPPGPERSGTEEER